MRGALLLLAAASALSASLGSNVHLTLTRHRSSPTAAAAAQAAVEISPAVEEPADAQCALPPHTLSFSCDGACAPFSPCLSMSPSPSNTSSKATASNSSSCAYECFQMSATLPDKYTEFVFLIPYGGSWKSAQEIAGSFSLEAPDALDDTQRFPSESNALLQKIESLVLPSQTTSVRIQGGSSLVSLKTKARVANVKLAPDLLTTQSQVRHVHLLNLNLAPFGEKLSAMLPANAVTIKLNNGLLSEFPPGLSKFKNLQTLNVNRNFVTKVSASMALPSVAALGVNRNSIATFDAVFPNLTVLDVAMNNLTAFPSVLTQCSRLETVYIDTNEIPAIEKSHTIGSLKELFLDMNRIERFEAHFPNLTKLHLRRNKLQAIPPVIYSHTRLTELILTGNAISNVTVTKAQVAFLSSLAVFRIDEASLYQDCPKIQQRNFHNLRFCLSDIHVDTIEVDDIVKKGKNSSSSSSSTKNDAMDSLNHNEEDARSDSFSSASLAIAIAVICLTLVLLVAIVLLYRRETAALRDEDEVSTASSSLADTYPSISATTVYHNNSSRNGGGARVSSSSIWEDAELLAVKMDVDAIHEVRQLEGSSEFGEVWLVRYMATRLLVSKRLKKLELAINSHAEKQEHRERIQTFIRGIKLASTLVNPKIVALVGAAWTIEADLQALFEFMDSGDLRTYLDDERTPRAWSLLRIQIAIDIAEALMFCHHSSTPPVVHRDLRSRKVLLSSCGGAKLSGFRASVVAGATNVGNAGGIKATRWLAPEVITGSSEHTPEADIYSFGVVLSELDTHRVPYEADAKARSLTEVALLQLVATGELKPKLSAACPQQIAELTRRCLALNPEDRPTAAELTYTLRVLKTSLTG